MGEGDVDPKIWFETPCALFRNSKGIDPDGGLVKHEEELIKKKRMKMQKKKKQKGRSEDKEDDNFDDGLVAKLRKRRWPNKGAPEVVGTTPGDLCFRLTPN